MNITPSTFRKKPVEIEAMRIINPVDSIETVLRWIRSGGGTAYLHLNCGGRESHLLIRTLEGDMIAALGDWVLRGVQGEFYPCKPDIFEATYEAVNTTDPFTEAAGDAAGEVDEAWVQDDLGYVAFELGAQWARTHLAQQNPLTEAIRAVAAATTLTGQDVAGIAQSLQHITQEPTDAEVEAAARTLLADYQSEYDGGHLEEFMDLARAALSAARNAGRAER